MAKGNSKAKEMRCLVSLSVTDAKNPEGGSVMFWPGKVIGAADYAEKLSRGLLRPEYFEVVESDEYSVMESESET